MGTVQSILLSFSIYDYWWYDKVNSRAHSMISISFHSGRQSADADCAISIDYNSESLNHVSKNVKSWQDENIAIVWVFPLDI